MVKICIINVTLYLRSKLLLRYNHSESGVESRLGKIEIVCVYHYYRCVLKAVSTCTLFAHTHPGISTCSKLCKPDVSLTQVGVNSIILDQFLKVTLTSFSTIALISLV